MTRKKKLSRLLPVKREKKEKKGTCDLDNRYLIYFYISLYLNLRSWEKDEKRKAMRLRTTSLSLGFAIRI